MRTPLLLLALGLSVAACDSTAPDRTDAQEAIGGLGWPDGNPMLMQITEDGGLENTAPPDVVVGQTVGLSVGSLWMTGVQGGELRGTVGSDGYSRSCGGQVSEPFALTRGVRYTKGEWPVERGAPSAADGSPVIYGDVMEWISLCTRPEPSPMGWRPLQGIRVNVALFSYRGESTRYVRYEIRNETTEPVTDLRLGMFADLEVSVREDAETENLAWDASHEIGYVFEPYWRYDGPPVDIAGIAFLERPGGLPPAAFRTVEPGTGRKAGGYQPPALAEQTLDPIEAYDFALQGMTNAGAPIVNPWAETPTTFMYPGDPVTNAGRGTWRDGWRGIPDERYFYIPWNAQMLLGAAPVSLAPDQTTVLTVGLFQRAVHAAAENPNAEARDAMLQTLREARSNPALWQFAPQN